ncbi:eukaryotic translation initiation factor 4 gamma 3-like [Watersipora subatra]|uniref:eukaryotic translation initiation factor 4 gamma 3-like n=1 Tax=Watersipora subatra TaxID=2589382 RepID=UPI00355BB354
MSGATRPPARGRAAAIPNSQLTNSRPPNHGHMHMSNPTQLPPMPYNNAQMYIPGTPITFPGGQITTSVPGFHQQYYVMSPHTPPVASQYWAPSAMATQSLPAQAQPSARPASNPSISAAVPPNMTMSSSFNGTMQQSQMQPTPQSNPYSQSLAQNSTRMPTQPLMANVQMVQPTQAAQTYTRPEGRKKNVIAIVDPNTKAIVNKDQMATSIGTATMGTSPASSSASTPQLPESDKGVRVEYSHSIKTGETQASQTPAKPDITAQFKAQVAQVASLSSSSVSVVSENTPPVLSSNVPSSSTEQTTSHPDKEASVKIISRNSSEVAENVAEAAGPAKDGKELSADVDIEQCTTDEQTCSKDETVESIQARVSSQEVKKPDDSSNHEISHLAADSAKASVEVTPSDVAIELDTSDFAPKSSMDSEYSLPGEPETEQLASTSISDIPATSIPDISATPIPDMSETPIPDISATPIPDNSAPPIPDISATPIPDISAIPILDISATPIPDITAPKQPVAEDAIKDQFEAAPTSDKPVKNAENICAEAPTNVQVENYEPVTESVAKVSHDHVEAEEPVLKATLSDRELMPPPAPVVPSVPLPTTPPVTENKENTPIPVISSPAKSAKSIPSHNSPLTPPDEQKSDDGKVKTYTRDFLMSLKEANLSQVKPDGLGSAILQEITYSGRSLPAMSVGKRDLNPEYFKPNSSPRGSMGNKRSSMSRDNKSMDATVGNRQHKIRFCREEVKLKVAEHAWKPGDKAAANFTEDEKAHLDLLKKFRGMLNKITPSTFEKLLVKILELPVKSEKDLTEVMILLFDKARNEPDFCRVYANLCQAIAKEYKIRKEDTGEEVNFRKVLLVRCQKEFEATDQDDRVMSDKLEILEKALKTAETDEEKARLNQEFKTEQTKVRHRKLGYMRFLGELYVLRMLTGNIMHQCVTSLLKASDEESLEYLCKLWTTIGKSMDSEEKARAYNDQYFQQMKKIATGQIRNVGVRIKFALKDVIELRENNWVPRRDKNIPKTLQEIHKQMAIEAHEKQQMIDKNLPSRNSQQGRAPPLPRNNRRSDDQDGWSHVKTSAQRVDPTKLKLTSQKMVGGDKELQLGPAKGFGGWSRGSSGSGKNTPPQQEEKSAVSSNRFSAFADRETRDNRSHSGNRMSSSRSGTKPRGRGGPGGQRMSTPRGSMEKEKNSAVEMARQLSREPRLNSRENSVEGRNMRTPTPTGVVVSRSSAQSTPTAVKQMKRNDWDTKMKSIIDEYLHNNDIKEVLDIVREELSGQNEMMLMTECAINHTLERSTQARKGTGLMLAELLKHKLLPLDAHIKGLGAVLEFADDLAIDIPNVWQYFGELIAPMFTTASVPLDRLVSVCNPLMSIGKASVLAAAVLKEASRNIGHVEIGKRWAESKLDWSKFLTEGEDQDEFIQSNKLEYTLSTQPQAQSSTELLPSDVAAQLNKFMLEGAENESVFDWIDSKLSPDMCDDNVFIGSLTTSVVQSCIANGSLNESKFKSRIPLLNKYYDSKASRELAALSALENLMTKLQHPANLFSDLCYAVSENDLITDESFLNWEKSSKTGIAVKSVSKFLQWLKEGLTIESNPTP